MAKTGLFCASLVATLVFAHASEPESSVAPVRLAYNYCTLSYTFAYFGENEWAQEIDRLSSAGYNAALVTDGTFKVWELTLRELGMSEEDIFAFIPDECARAWWLMGNLAGEGGPLDQATVDADGARGRFIAARMREKGIEPVLQGFYGMVPATLSAGPLLEQGKWCRCYDRPPILDPTSPDFARCAAAWYRSIETVYGIKPKYLAGDLFHEGGKTEGIDVTAAVRAVQAAQQSSFPGVTWVVQAWMKNPTPEVRAGLDPRHTLIEALVMDMSAFAHDDATCELDFGELPWIWCEVLNFGGNHGLYGNLKTFARLGRAAKGKGARTFRGYGALSEGFFTNPVCSDLFEEMMMRPAGSEMTDAELDAWLARRTARRYGFDDARLAEAWRILASTAYACNRRQEGTVENVICAKPGWTADSASSWGPKGGLWYDPAELERAASLFEEAWKESHSFSNATAVANFARDRYDVRRQAWANRLRALVPQLKDSAEARHEFLNEAESFNVCTAFGIPPEFRLSTWLDLARARAGERGEKAWMRMITTWSDAKYGATVLADYANREYAELVRDHYLPRWRRFLEEPAVTPQREPRPQPGIRVVNIRADEKPVKVDTAEETVSENAFFRRVKATFTFTNPNARQMAGEFEFPIPDGAFVCRYALEVNGEMVPGVVCEKEKARVAFENEIKKGVDPGLVEQVKGNVWKTRIFPLVPNTPRKAEVEYIAPKDVGGDAPATVCERDGDDVFAASVMPEDCAGRQTVAQTIAAFSKGTILWDASMSAKPFAAEWRKKLEALPENGEWTLVVFRHVAEAPRAIAGRGELLAALDALVYDGGTDLAAAVAACDTSADLPVLLFTDEVDTMGLETPKYEEMDGLTVASRDDAPARKVEVKKLKAGETPPAGAEVKEGRILATVWAARRMQDLASQADSRKDEFLALGRKYGVAGPGLSLIVLERLEQWLEHKIEPPANLAIHDEWVRRRAAEDDPIADKKAKAEHEQNLLRYWEERVKWWNDPKPRKATPKSGLFDNVTTGTAVDGAIEPSAAAPVLEEAVLEEEPDGAAPRANRVTAAPESGLRAPVAMRAMAGSRRRESAPMEVKAAPPGAAGSGAAPTVRLKAWDPKTPYIDALKSAEKGRAYEVYLAQREEHGSSPAFYLDCAGWFYKAGEKALAERILSNLAEFKLEDAALWRSMGWRAREAGSCDLAVRAFRKVLAMRGEEAQSRRDLALVLAEYGKDHMNAAAVEEAMKLFAEAAFEVNARRSGRRGNDFQVSVVALEELNGLISWSDAAVWPGGASPAQPRFDAAYRRDLPVKLRIVMSWDADETDIDLHVLEPNGEEAYYGHRRTAEGGFVSEDVTTGYGPEEYLKKELESGTYKILSNYFASHQTALTGATTVTATVYTDWGTAEEKRQILTMRLDRPKSKNFIGEVTLGVE